MRISCSRGSAKQLEDVVRNALGGVNSGTTNMGRQTVSAASGLANQELLDVEKKILDAVGSRAALNPALSVNFGDGNFGWVYYNDSSGEVELLDGSGVPLESSVDSVVAYVTNTWKEDSQSITSASDFDGGVVDSDYVSQVVAELHTQFETSYPMDVTITQGADDSISIVYEYGDAGDYDEGFISVDELTGEGAEAEAIGIAEEFYTNSADINSATNTSNISATPIMSGNAGQVPQWLLKYYDVVSDEELARRTGVDISEVEEWKVDGIEGYDVTHVAWIDAKQEYSRGLDWLTSLEIVSEGGEIFPATMVGGRIYDSTDEIKRSLGLTDMYGDDTEDDSYETMYRDDSGMLGTAGEVYTIEDLQNYWNSSKDDDPSLAAYTDMRSWLDDTLPYLTEL